MLILGGGNAGFGVTVPTRGAGLKVALVEERDLGGTCPNRGCTPKKVLVAAGHALHEIKQAHVHGISVAKPELDWAALIDREKEMISGIPDSLAETLQERGVDPFRDSACFVGPNANKVGSRTIEAKHIVIATGSRPRSLPIQGAELMITSDEVLSEHEQPGSVVFVGGGVSRLLPERDEDAVEHIRAESERIGIEVPTGVKVARVEKSGNQLRTVFGANGKERSVVSDRVVNGAGRIANVDYLDLEAGGVAHAGFRLAVDDYLRSASTPPSMRAATFYPARRNSRPSPPTKGSSSAATSSRGRSTSPSMRAFRPPSTPCRHWRAG